MERTVVLTKTGKGCDCTTANGHEECKTDCVMIDRVTTVYMAPETYRLHYLSQ